MIIFGDITRVYHFAVGVGLWLTLTILCCLGAMTAAEYKDRDHGGQWDWVDWTWGMVGGAIGQAVAIGIFLLFT